jgi:TetR/AcrR family transcriptional regulator, repressor of fatR-cypB operon
MNVHSFQPGGRLAAVKAKQGRVAALTIDDKRARILAAALDLFEKRGFDGVAVPEIARAAGVATGTIYRYFRTKEELVNALYRHWKSAYNEQILRPVPDGLEVRETFALYWRRMAEFARKHYRAVRFLDLHYHAPYLDAESRAMEGIYMETAKFLMNEGRNTGTLRDLDPALVVALLWGATAGLNKFVHDGRLVFNEATSRAMEDALWRAIAANTNGHGKKNLKGKNHGTKKKR